MIDYDFGRRIFVLEVGGLSTRYVSSDVDISSTNLNANLTTGVPYVNKEGIVSVGAYQASVDPAGGIANYSPLTVSLSIDRFRGDTTDPHVVFGRCGPRATDVSKAQIATEILHKDATKNITIDQDFTSLSYPRVMHIGAETVRVSAATSTTLTISNRGVGRTPIQNHTTTIGGTNVPEVFTEIVTFRGRKVSLYMGQMNPDGYVESFTEIINGFIESTPNISEDSVSLSLVPLTALIDNNISEISLETGLVEGYHNFDDFNGSKLEYGVACMESESFNLVGSTGSGTLTVATADQPLEIASAFDESLYPGSDGTYLIHPRYPDLTNSAGGRLFAETMTASTLTYDSGNLTYNSLVPSGGSTTFRVKVATPRGEVKSYRMTSGIQRFPAIVNDVLEANHTGSSQGANGSFAQWTIADDTTLIIKSNVNREAARTSIIFYSSKRALSRFERMHGINTPMSIWSDTSLGIYQTQNLERLWYPFDVWSEGRPFPEDPLVEEGTLFHNRAEFAEEFAAPILENQSSEQKINGIARAYYQNGESTILVKHNLGLPSSATAGVSYDIEVAYYDRNLDQESFQTFPVTHQTTATYSGSDIGFLLHIEEPFSSSIRRSFGDWEGYESTKIYLTTRINFQTPGQAILQILQSGGGSSINGSYDKSSVGLNIDEIEIDVQSFLQYESIPNLMINLDLRGQGTDLRATLTPLLQAMGSVLVMRRNRDGRSKLALQPLGMDQTSAAAITINQGDWLADDPPTWDTYEDIISQVEVNFDYDISEQKLRTKRIFNNQEAINRYGGEKSKLTLDLFGLSSDQIGSTGGDSFSFFLPVVSRIFNLLSNPLRTWRGSIGTGQSALIDIGRYALVSSDRLKAYGQNYGVTDGVGLIRSIRQELMNEGCELEILTTGTRTVGWNDSSKVLTVPTTTTVTIDQDVFSNTNLLGETVKDSSFFKVDDVVDYVLEGDHDNSIAGLTIQSIVDNGTDATITFTAAHGISSAGGTLEPTIYTNATADQKLDAYIANSSGILGTADEGKELA